MSLEYALNVPKSFWLNLQANYDAELLELNESQTVTEAEKKVCQSLTEIIKYLRKQQLIPVGQKVKKRFYHCVKDFKLVIWKT